MMPGCWQWLSRTFDFQRARGQPGRQFLPVPDSKWRWATIRHLWIWEQGGGYFGVPLTNYLGWFFTVYVFFQLFALYLRFRKASREGEEPTLPRSYYAQAIVMYAVIGLVIVVNYLVGSTNMAITDAVGIVWQTRSIAEAEATVSIFTMLFAAALSAVKVLQGSAAVASTPVEAKTGETALQERPPVRR